MARRVKQAVFKFKPFSKKQKMILTWWTKKSAVKDKDGIYFNVFILCHVGYVKI